MEKARNFACQDCGKKFDRKFCLKRHESNVHMKEVWRIRDMPSKTRNKFFCNECDRSFANDSNLRRHIRTADVHKEPQVFICDVCAKSCCTRTEFREHWSKAHSLKVISLRQCPICRTDVKSEDILNHFDQTHNIKTEVQEFSFPDENTFLIWKKETEEKNYSRFVKFQSFRRNSPVMKFVCHRSGFFKSESKGYRRLRNRRSIKMNGYCPASIRVKKCGTEFRVKFTTTHIHPGSIKENEVCHLSISPIKKEKIARKSMDKIPKSCNIENICDSYDGIDLQRVHFISVQDVTDADAKFNVSSEFKQHQDDALNVDLTVEKLKKKGDTVLFYKAQDKETDACSFLQTDDFVLILMNSVQAKLLKQFGQKVICVDVIHGVGYDFNLFSILVMVEYHQGFPSALMISNRKDTQVLELFYSKVKEKVGTINCNIFLSDMATELYNAWQNVMGSVNLQLYCAWRVNKAWNDNIKKKVKDPNEQDELHKKLKVLMYELDEDKFNILFAQLKEMFKAKSVKEFGDYFMQYYASVPQTWAYCFRKNSTINTNINLEEMHRTIKYLYFSKKSTNQLDKTIHCLLKFINDQLFDRLTALCKGKVSHKLKILRLKHRLWHTVQVTNTDKDFTTFLVTSGDEVYHVQQNLSHCKCKLVCTHCNACIHKYTCECFDYIIHWNMCKHIHAVCKFISNSNHVTDPDPSIEDVIVSSDGEEERVKIAEIASEIRRQRVTVTKKSLRQCFFKILNRVKTRAARISFLKSLNEAGMKVDILERRSSISVRNVRFHGKNITKLREQRRKLFSTRTKSKKEY